MQLVELREGVGWRSGRHGNDFGIEIRFQRPGWLDGDVAESFRFFREERQKIHGVGTL